MYIDVPENTKKTYDMSTSRARADRKKRHVNSAPLLVRFFSPSEISLSREKLHNVLRTFPTRASSGSSAENAPQTSGSVVKFLRYAH